jgi:hypothetical protein
VIPQLRGHAQQTYTRSLSEIPSNSHNSGKNQAYKQSIAIYSTSEPPYKVIYPIGFLEIKKSWFEHAKGVLIKSDYH